jgi:hypothetical protein
MTVRIILPVLKTDVIATRGRKYRSARKVTGYLLLDRSGETGSARKPGVILLTFTA